MTMQNPTHTKFPSVLVYRPHDERELVGVFVAWSLTHRTLGKIGDVACGGASSAWLEVDNRA